MNIIRKILFGRMGDDKHVEEMIYLRRKEERSNGEIAAIMNTRYPNCKYTSAVVAKYIGCQPRAITVRQDKERAAKMWNTRRMNSMKKAVDKCNNIVYINKTNEEIAAETIKQYEFLKRRCDIEIENTKKRFNVA